jgi:glycosyltransferase involved in cell wall biosynthesis
MEPIDLHLAAQVPAETQVISVPYPRGYGVRVLARTAPYTLWLPRALTACIQAVGSQRIDAVLTSGPPHCVHLLGLFLKRRYQLPWLLDLRDPWYSGRLRRHGGLRRYWEALWERQAIKQADAIIANAPLACETLRGAFPSQEHKLVTITNGYDPERFPAGLAPAPPARGVRLVHAGEIYEGRDPRAFLDAVGQLRAEATKDTPPFQVHFLGRSSHRSFNLPAEIQQRHLKSVVAIGGQVSYGQALQDMMQAHVLLLLDTPGRRDGVPAKLYEYLGTGRPILALAEPDGDVAWVLKQSGLLHRIVSPQEPAQIKAALAQLLEAVVQDPIGCPNAQRIHRFTREHMTHQLVKVLDRCLDRPESLMAPSDEPRKCFPAAPVPSPNGSLVATHANGQVRHQLEPAAEQVLMQPRLPNVTG